MQWNMTDALFIYTLASYRIRNVGNPRAHSTRMIEPLPLDVQYYVQRNVIYTLVFTSTTRVNSPFQTPKPAALSSSRGVLSLSLSLEREIHCEPVNLNFSNFIKGNRYFNSWSTNA